MKIKRPESTADIPLLLKWAQRGQGWAFRDYPPQFKLLPCGCELIVLVPTLWRPRVGPRPCREGKLINLAEARQRVTGAAVKPGKCMHLLNTVHASNRLDRVTHRALHERDNATANLDLETGDLFDGMQA